MSITQRSYHLFFLVFCTRIVLISPLFISFNDKQVILALYKETSAVNNSKLCSGFLPSNECFILKCYNIIICNVHSFISMSVVCYAKICYFSCSIV